MCTTRLTPVVPVHEKRVFFVKNVHPVFELFFESAKPDFWSKTSPNQKGPPLRIWNSGPWNEHEIWHFHSQIIKKPKISSIFKKFTAKKLKYLEHRFIIFIIFGFGAPIWTGNSTFSFANHQKTWSFPDGKSSSEKFRVKRCIIWLPDYYSII